MDLRQGYNNIQIKKKDEWKMAFTISEGLFELTVTFFRLINLFAIFQTIMNKILQNLINTEKIASFIDNIIVRIKKEKGYEKIVEEVVKWLVKNNLYMKR